MTHVAKFAPSLGPVSLPPTPPEPKPLHPPPEPLPRLPEPPVHQASLLGNPPSLAPPSQPFPDPFPWNQGPWSTPPSTRPEGYPTGHPSKKAIFLFVRVSGNTTHVAKFAPSLGRPYHLPPRNRSPCTPPPRLPDPPVHQASSRWIPRQANPSFWNQGPWSTPPATRPAPAGTLF